MTARALRTPRHARSIATKVNDPLAVERVAFNKSSAASASGVTRVVYANVFRRNAVYITAVVFAAILGTGAYDAAFEAAWEANNKGKLYKDIIGRYPGLPPNTEEEGASDAAAEEEEEEASEE